MRDLLCLIPPKHLLNNKYYSNIAELSLRNRATSLCLSHHDVNADLLSDYELFYEMCKLSNTDRSKVFGRFLGVLTALGFGISDLVDPERVWRLIAERLCSYEWTLHGMIERSGLDGITVRACEDLPKAIGNVEINQAVIAESVPIDTKYGFDAVFLYDFEFEKPNPYTADRAREKLSNGATLKDSERRILKSQAMREYLFLCAEIGKEPMLFLPPSPNIETLCAVKSFLDYMDGTSICPTNMTLFASDLVSYQFALSLKHTKIKAEAAISGNGFGFIDKGEIEYWGGAMPKKQATLATTGIELLLIP